jgi:hypothetical protein
MMMMMLALTKTLLIIDGIKIDINIDDFIIDIDDISSEMIDT